MKYVNQIIFTSLAIATLTACSGGDQDTGNTSTTFVSGRAVDGAITQGVAYVDTNGNNMLDGWEPSAFTDSKGYFSYNPTKNGGYNYCDSTVEEDEKFCLEVPAGIKSAPIRISGGYDLSTGEKFFGTLTLDVTISDTSATQPVAITPITAMIHASELAGTGFPANETLTDTSVLSQDYMDLTNTLTEDQRRNMLRLAMHSHKTAEVIASYIGDPNVTTNKFAGASDDQPYDIVPYVQKAIAAQLTGSTTLDQVLADATALGTVTDAAWQEVYDYLLAKEQVFDAPVASIVSTVAARVTGLSATIESLFGGAETVDDTYIKQRLRAIEVIAALMRDTTVNDTIIASAITAATDATYLTNIGVANADVAYVIELFKTNAYTGPADVDFSNRETFADNFTTDADGNDFLGVNDGQGTNFGFSFKDDGTVDVTGTIGGDGGTAGAIDVNTEYEQIDDNTIVMNMELVEGSGIYQPVVLKTNNDGSGYTVDYGEGPSEFVTDP